MFGSDNNAMGRKLQAKARKKSTRGPQPVQDEREYLQELEQQRLAKQREREDLARREKQEILDHYRNYSLATS